MFKKDKASCNHCTTAPILAVHQGADRRRYGLKLDSFHIMVK